MTRFCIGPMIALGLWLVLSLSLPASPLTAQGTAQRRSPAPTIVSQGYRKLPKPVYSSDPEILASNGFVRDIRNLTAHFFFGKVKGDAICRILTPPSSSEISFRRVFGKSGIDPIRDSPDS